ncbi:MAG: hypothetical protein ACUVQK_11795 [Thermogutta sp.]
MIETPPHSRETTPCDRSADDRCGPSRGECRARSAGAGACACGTALGGIRSTPVLLCLSVLLWGGLGGKHSARAERPRTQDAIATRFAESAGDLPWRRTKDGWEPAWWLAPPKTFYRPGLHPLWLVAVQVLYCAAVAFAEDRRNRRRQLSPRSA